MSSTRRERVLTLLGREISKRAGVDCSVLDVGIGNGEIGEFCQRSQHTGLFTEGVDVSNNLLEHNKHKYDRMTQVNVDDPHWTEHVSRRFDIIVVSEVLEHLFRPDLFLERAKTIMKPGGVIIITTPNLLLWSKRLKFLFGWHEWANDGLFEWGHIHMFSWYFLQKVLKEKEYTIIDSYHLMHPNALNKFHKHLPGILAYQFIITVTSV